MLEDTNPEPAEPKPIDAFISADHKHNVHWTKSSEDEPPNWWCNSHNRPYSECILNAE